jgi:hypothetical protein
MPGSVRAMRLPAACRRSPCSSATLRCNFPAHCSREISCKTRTNASFLTHSGASADGETDLIPCRFACYGNSKRYICKPYSRPEAQRIRAIWSRIFPPVTLSVIAFADGNAAELRRFRGHSLISFRTERLGGGDGVRHTPCPPTSVIVHICHSIPQKRADYASMSSATVCGRSP